MKIIIYNNIKMLIPVKCFTCGKVIGDKYLYFQEEVIKEKRDKHINPDEIQYLDEKSAYEGKQKKTKSFWLQLLPSVQKSYLLR